MQLEQKVRLPLSMLQLRGWEEQQSPLAAGAAQPLLSPRPGLGSLHKQHPATKQKGFFSSQQCTNSPLPGQKHPLISLPCSQPSTACPSPGRRAGGITAELHKQPWQLCSAETCSSVPPCSCSPPKGQTWFYGQRYRWLQR